MRQRNERAMKGQQRDEIEANFKAFRVQLLSLSILSQYKLLCVFKNFLFFKKYLYIN